MNTTLFDKLFRDANGEIVIAQAPNLPLIVWLAASLLKLIDTNKDIDLGLDILAAGSLFIWAIQELFQGVNYFRRGLGAIVLIWLIASKIQQVATGEVALQ